MKKLLLILLCLPMIGFGQSDKKIKKTYGGMPTANENMSWEENTTPDEKYIGVFQIDSTISALEVIEAFMITFQPLQDANIMTKQMRNNNAFGSVASAMSGDYKSMDDLSSCFFRHLDSCWSLNYFIIRIYFIQSYNNNRIR